MDEASAVRLPNGKSARVDRAKVVEYLLNKSHPDGSGKAGFFSRFGFALARWGELAAALRLHGQTQPVVFVVESAHGTRYTVQGPLKTPDGRKPCVRTVWIMDLGSDAPRLITAYPAG